MMQHQSGFAAHCALLACFGALCAMTAAGQSAVTLFSDDFDAGTSAPNWTVRSHGGDYTADFAFDYSARGIPSAPHSAGGTTVGLRLLVNANDSTAVKDAVSVYPRDFTLGTGPTLRFDLWMNYNGGAGGGPGSTQFAIAGVHQSGAEVCWADNPASDGLWFAVSGEGGDADDYRAVRGATLLSIAQAGYAALSRNHTDPFYQDLFPSPPFETAGAPGQQWVAFEIRRRGDALEWRLNGRLIAIRLDPSASAGTILLGLMDTYASIADPPDDTFIVVDNVRVTAVDCDGNGVADAADVADAGRDCNGTDVPDACEALEAGDFDADGDVDGADLDALGGAQAGPGVPPADGDPNCVDVFLEAFDLDGDGAIDLRDFSDVQLHGRPGPFAPRAAGAPAGSRFIAEVAGLSQAAREARIVEEVLGGNVPGYLREFVPIDVSATIAGAPVQATYFVTRDYLAIGHERDFVRMPMTPLIAQPIADALGCLLPTRKMVNDIYVHADEKLAPQPISPATTDITRVTTYFRHHELIEEQRGDAGPRGLIGGIKKDVVITPLLESSPGRVAIYGWHRLTGAPIQPLYLGHIDTYVDYSHGIRLVRDRMIVAGEERCVADVLADPVLHVLLSDEGVVTRPRY